jgi:hypothetical protein
VPRRDTGGTAAAGDDTYCNILGADFGKALLLMSKLWGLDLSAGEMGTKAKVSKRRRKNNE